MLLSALLLTALFSACGGKQEKTPGLGVRSLHEQGITSEGVNVALIDPPAFYRAGPGGGIKEFSKTELEASP